MKIRTFRGRSMQEALERVRREAGSDAVILSTGTSLGGEYEVSVALEKPSAAAARAGTAATAGSFGGGGGGRRQGQLRELLRAAGGGPEMSRDGGVAGAGSARGGRRKAGSSGGGGAGRAGNVGGRGQSSRAGRSSGGRSAPRGRGGAGRGGGEGAEPGVPPLAEVNRRLGVLESYIRFQVPYESPVFTRLLEGGVEEAIVREIAESCTALTPRETELYVEREVKQRLGDCRPLRAEEEGPIAFVGAAGVGKTTTLAKLAARFSLGARRRVGLLTLDTQRIAAVQQLRTYARILDLPLRVVTGPNQAREAVAALGECDSILVDTGGTGGRASPPVALLGEILEAIGVRELLLTLSARSAAADLRASARRLASLAPTRVVVTQIDETVRPGILLTAADLGLPISHITFGPAVPDDIREARATDLTALIMQEPARA